MNLEHEWQQLWAHQQGLKVPVPEAFAELHRHYSEPQRAYHNLTHLRHLLELQQQYRHHLQQPFAVALAIWYHDIIYNPRRQDNEEKSAELAQQRLADWGLAETIIQRVVAMIRATAHHLDVSAEPQSDLAYFLDFDLAILGSSPEDYAVYAAAVRQEYRHVPGFLYRRGRKKVLRYFLQAPQLFRSAPFLALEEQARTNLREELAAC